MDWNELILTVNAADIDRAGDIAHMTVPYGIYIEDYRNLEQETLEVAHIDLIDEELLAKDRSKGLLHIYISPEENPAEAVAFLAERFTAVGIAYTLTTRICRNEDWENNWKAYFKPMEIGNKLLIRPVWERVEDTHARAVFSIEPGLAFGIGSHETTRLCLEALEERVSEGSTVLDIGCGSGILGICALLLGAKTAIGVDLDAMAVKTALENGRLNGFGPPVYTVIHGNLADEISGTYRLITANIVADAIIALCEAVPSLLDEDGVFITSGIIDTREDEVLAAFADHGLTVLNRRESGGWVCFECRKSR